ncbi:hypothetical protein KQ313_01450 [Synechococcus sp. CS-1325]|uniref:hypothetical protein n=1 Tax=Synechococcus sp. CS-1325 TaxID=2847979 RepID=UPI000DB3D3BE|nr:hypothetical protein [Synechococcus sp. CS-1325]MCT0198354.1 hypothetical protein [Synechococcus sp. CS-1325]PZV00211.1 MAG: hypothetical protein DCF24_07735 [Cyanobium sp.]
MRRVIVHIDRLVLKGFRPQDRFAIAAGLEQELSTLFADPQAVRQLTARGDRSRMRVEGVRIEQGLKPQGVGVETARGIRREMTA